MKIAIVTYKKWSRDPNDKIIGENTFCYLSESLARAKRDIEYMNLREATYKAASKEEILEYLNHGWLNPKLINFKKNKYGKNN